MSLNKKQVEFSRVMAKFQVWCFQMGYEFIEGESYRTPYQAKEYARLGKGIMNSTHCKKLARDLFRYKDGTVTWNHSDYEAMGQQWKRMHPLARWGGDFKGRDAVHFSFEHKGVK